MIAGYAASPKGQEAIRNYLSSPEGQKAIDSYMATPEGRSMARLVLSRALESLDLTEDVKTRVLHALEEKQNTGS
jgi:hypothetical protein